MIIAIEGVDAVGKATQSRLLAERLKAKLFSFPAYDAPFGDLIRGHLQRTWYAAIEQGTDAKQNEVFKSLDARVFQCVQLANKAALAPAIEDAAYKGHVVLDRYWPSACVYAAEDGFADLDLLIKMHAVLPQPDLFILLDVSVKETQARLAARAREKDRYELQPITMVAARRERYLGLWRYMNAWNWVTVDGNGTKEQTAEKIAAATRILGDG